jgi:hypothetical protein
MLYALFSYSAFYSLWQIVACWLCKHVHPAYPYPYIVEELPLSTCDLTFNITNVKKIISPPRFTVDR